MRLFSVLLVMLAFLTFVDAARADQPASEPPSSTIVARAGDLEVSLEDIQAFIAQVRMERKQASLPDADTLMGVAELLLARRILADEAHSSKLDQAPEVVARLRLERERLLSDLRLQQVVSEADSTDFGQLAYETYLANKDRYGRPEQAKASHILIDTKDRSDEEALQTAQDLYGQLTENPDLFEQFAKEYSDDPNSGRKGGDLGWFAKEKMVAPFAEAAFALTRNGEISPPVKTRFGYHIIRLDDRKAGEQFPFDKVRPQIIAQLREKHRKDLKGSYLQEIRSRQGIEYDRNAVEAYAAALHAENPDGTL